MTEIQNINDFLVYGRWLEIETDSGISYRRLNLYDVSGFIGYGIRLENRVGKIDLSGHDGWSVFTARSDAISYMTDALQ